MQEAPKFKLIAVPPEEPAHGGGAAEESLLVLALDDGDIVVGIAPTNTDLWDRFSIMSGRSYMPNIFAQGICENCVIRFDKDTPPWKQEAVMRFLAVQALQMALANKEREERALRQLASDPFRGHIHVL